MVSKRELMEISSHSGCMRSSSMTLSIFCLNRPIRKAGKKPFNEEPKFDTSSGEEEDVKFNFKPSGVRARRTERKPGGGVAFHSKQVATSKARTKPREINSSESEEEVIFNFKPNGLPQIQITEATSGESSEESDGTDSKKRPVMIVNSGRKNPTRKLSTISSRNLIRGLKLIMKVRNHS
jgi:hypothetical protein